MTFSSYLFESFVSCVIPHHSFSWFSVTILFYLFFISLLLQFRQQFLCTSSPLYPFYHSINPYYVLLLPLHCSFFVFFSIQSFLFLPSYPPFTALFTISFYPFHSISSYPLLTTLLSIFFYPFLFRSL
jgi:hypothetical protein